MPVDSIRDDPRPQSSRSVRVDANGGGHLGDEADDALGDGIEVVIVWRAGCVVQSSFGSEFAEGVGDEPAFAVGVHNAHARPRMRSSLVVERRADSRVERGHASEDC